MLSFLIQKEIIQFRRNSFLPRLAVMFPIVIMCVMPWVMDMEVRNIKVAVVDNDRSTTSSRLTHDIEASNYFIFCGLCSGNDEAIRAVERGDIDVFVTIPRHYERNLMAGADATELLISANAVDGTKGSMGASYMASIIGNEELRTKNLELSSGTSALLSGQSQGCAPITSHSQLPTFNFQLSTLNLYNKHLNYKVFMIPALMSLLMMLLCGFLPALNIVSEKEAGTIEQINVTPVSKWAFILAKLIPYWFIGIFVLTVCFLLSWLIYGIVPQGNVGLLYFISILLALTFSGFGLIVSNYSDTMQQAVFVMWFFVVCMMLLSGLFTPVRSMPHWAQLLTQLNPIRHYIDAMRTVFVRGGGLADVSVQVIALAFFAAIMNVWAVASYRKNAA